MNYIPIIKSAQPKQRFQIGKHTAILLGDIKSDGPIEYRYIMAVFDDNTQKPCFFVASEVSSMAKSRGGGSHFLGLFYGDGHANCGASDDWGNEEKFTAEALRIIREMFGVHA